MKKITLIILFMTGTLIGANANPPASAEKRTRDSLFQVAASEPNDSLRSRLLRKSFQQYIGQPQGVEFLDSALALATRKQIHAEELYTLFDYCRHYEFCTDEKNMERYFQKLKGASYRYKSYTLYYTVWLAMIQAQCARGDTEFAIIEAKEMREETQRIKYESGVLVSLLALAQAYSFAEQYDDAINTYNLAVKEAPNRYSLLMIHSKLTRIYLAQKNYPEALKESQLQAEAIRNILKEDPQAINNLKTGCLEVEMSFGKIYKEMRDKDNLRLHLERAGRYYDKESFFSSYVDYHALWGAYYMLTKEWASCFRHFDLALSACNGKEPFHENHILKGKAEALMEAGKYKEAAELYKVSVLRGDSLNREVLLRHKEVHQINYKIKKALYDKEETRKHYRWIQVGTSAGIFLLLVFATLRAFFIQRQLRHSERETRKALNTIQAADKMKESFLKSITYEIRIPLNTVVGFSELLSSEKDLSTEEVQEYSTAIKTNSEKLLALINNILDLSRLEAGMMRFTVEECDIVQLCKEAKMMINMQTPDTVELDFHTTLEALSIQADTKWFLKLLTSLFAVPRQYAGETRKVEYTLKRDKRFLTILVKGSPLYLIWEDEQEQRILHDINRLYVETLKGSYQILGKERDKLVTIILPIS